MMRGYRLAPIRPRLLLSPNTYGVPDKTLQPDTPTMKCLLYIPTFECEGTHVPNIALVRVGGLTLYQRVCRSLQDTEFEVIIVAKP